MTTIYFIIVILFVIYLFCVWNSTKEFETILIRISYMVVGTIFITVLTLLLFQIAKIGVSYPKKEMVGQVRKIIMLIFIPINGLITLTQFSNTFVQIKGEFLSKEKMSQKIKILTLLLVFFMIIECIYFKKIQYGILGIFYSK